MESYTKGTKSLIEQRTCTPCIHVKFGVSSASVSHVERLGEAGLMGQILQFTSYVVMFTMSQF